MNKVLVLGNSNQINEIDFTRLDSSIITFGVNRIWLKFSPNYLFFNDLEILDEILENKREDLFLTTKFLTSNYILRKTKARSLLSKYTIQILHRSSYLDFTDSVSNGLDLFNKYILKNGKTTFYIAGVPLTWEEPSHFWKKLNYSSRNKNTKAWYSQRFQFIYKNFEKLKVSGLNIISSTPNSKLNKLFRFENVSNLYTSPTQLNGGPGTGPAVEAIFPE
jgi:hypothetical protein